MAGIIAAMPFGTGALPPGHSGGKKGRARNGRVISGLQHLAVRLVTRRTVFRRKDVCDALVVVVDLAFTDDHIDMRVLRRFVGTSVIPVHSGVDRGKKYNQADGRISQTKAYR